MLKKVWGRVVSAVQGVGEAVSTGAGKVFAVGASVIGVGYAASMSTAMAADSISIPDIGVDWGSIGTSAGQALGEVVIGLVGVAVAVAIVKAGIRLMRSMFS